MASGVALSSPIAIIAAGGSMPFAVAEALRAKGQEPVIFGVRGLCDETAITRFRHRWIAFGKLGELLRFLKSEGCRDLVTIGAVSRPALSDLRFDLGTLRALPDIVAAFRGGDDHLLTRAAGIFEKRGFRWLGIHDVAPEVLMPEGRVTRAAPDADAEADIAKGRAVLAALSPFDIGQAVVVIDRHVVGVEGIEGTDGLLARIADLRTSGRIRKKSGRGVLVKAPKQGQDLRFDLPAIGPRTVEGVVQAGLAGLAVAAGGAVAAEPQRMIEIAERAGVFVFGFAR
jgi:DUF1009 family protein